MSNRSEIDEFSFRLGELTQAVKESNKKIDKVDRQNGEILGAIKDITLTCAKRNSWGEEINDNKEAIETLESNGVSKRTQQKINTGLFLGIFNGLITLIKGLMGWV